MTEACTAKSPPQQEEQTETKIDIWRKKLRYRSWHRGTREMDLIMGRFADTNLPQFNETQLAEYEQLLTENDPDLYNWITHREPVPAEAQSSVMDLLVKNQ
jgi:antitoxin CptB